MASICVLRAEHVTHLLARARRLARNEADAHDLVQDTCLNALEALRRMDEQPENLQAWLVTVMRNHWFTILRHRKIRQDATTELFHDLPNDSALCKSRVLYPPLARAWDGLSEQAQTIALQRLFDGDSHEEVSRRFGITPEAWRRRFIARASNCASR